MTRAVRIPGDKAAAAKAEKPIPATAPVSDDSDLPNAVDIDPHSITSPVLTKQGWVCQADKPNPAVVGRF